MADEENCVGGATTNIADSSFRSGALHGNYQLFTRLSGMIGLCWSSDRQKVYGLLCHSAWVVSASLIYPVSMICATKLIKICSIRLSKLLSAVIVTLATRQATLYLSTDGESVPRPFMGLFTFHLVEISIIFSTVCIKTPWGDALAWYHLLAHLSFLEK